MRFILVAVVAAVSTTVAPMTAVAAGATLTVPTQVQAPPGGDAVLDTAFRAARSPRVWG